jgi:hypothetical protein
MPFLFIRLCNSHFGSVDEGAEYVSKEAAMSAGVRGAVAIAGDEVFGGERAAAVDICIEDQNGKTVLRSVVAILVSPLLVMHPSHVPGAA